MTLDEMEVGDNQFIAKEEWKTGCQGKKIYAEAQELSKESGKMFEINMDHAGGFLYNISIKRTK